MKDQHLNSRVSEYGVLMDTVFVLEYKGDHVSYYIRKALYNGEEYFSSSVSISGFGIQSGFSGPVSIHCKSKYQDEVDFILKYFEDEAVLNDKFKEYLNKVPLYKNKNQLQLF